MNDAQLVEDKIEDGFSSQEQFKQEQILYTQTVQQKKQTAHKEEVKFKIPPPQEIKDKKYSLRPDIATGWQPKIQLPSPIPIMFDSPKYDAIIKRLLKKPLVKAKVCYLGPKYENTYYAWYDKKFTFPYSHIKSPHNIKFSQRPFCGQHWQAEEGLIFDSFFESGNLDCVIQVGQAQYDLFMRVDSNTRGHLQWFNFKIKNLVKDKQYRINICNFQKKKILFGRGQKPYVFSAQRFAKQKIGWEQRGQNVVYQKKICKTLKVLEIQNSKYFRLSFDISTNYEKDELQIAYCIPYTYSQMSEYLHKKLKELQRSGRQILKMSKLCNSLGGLQVPLLIIHESHKQKAEENVQGQLPNIKRCVIVCGRAHPGQSNGSFMMEGFLDFICGESKMAEFLRKHVIFKIVPMMNPDGVALGNYRTGLSGKDFNRQYKDPDRQIFPEVYSFKKLVSENKFIFKENLNVFLDFHGHSVKKNTFAYGPQFPIVNKFYYESRIFPKLIGNMTPMFRYYSCSFKVSECKNTTARAVLLKKLNISLAYTIQTSNGFYFDYEKLKDIPYTDAKWKQMGQKVGQALHEYMQLVVKSDILRHEKQKTRKITKKDIIIRKTGRSFSNQKGSIKNQFINYQKSQHQSIILEGIQDQNIKNLFEQIKKAEEEKQKFKQDQKCSDDELSEGSSDGQGNQDDLSSQQRNRLFDCIKNKNFKNLDKCKISSLKRNKTHDINEDNEDQNSSKQKYGKQVKQQFLNRMSQQIILKKRTHKVDEKNDFIFNLIESKKRSNTPKVINFSFGFNSTPQNNTQQQSNILPSKVNFFDVANCSNRNDDSHSRNDKNRLNDMMFRKTYNSATKQRKQKYRQGGDRANIFVTTNYGTKSSNKQNVSKQHSGIQMTTTCQPFYAQNKKMARFQKNRIQKIVGQNIAIVQNQRR